MLGWVSMSNGDHKATNRMWDFHISRPFCVNTMIKISARPSWTPSSSSSSYGCSIPRSFSALPAAPNVVAAEMYNGPFVARARALVDCTPSPYDREALRFKVKRNIFQYGALCKVGLFYLSWTFSLTEWGIKGIKLSTSIWYRGDSSTVTEWVI